MNCIDACPNHILDHAIAEIVAAAVQKERFAMVVRDPCKFFDPGEKIFPKILGGENCPRVVAKIVGMSECPHAIEIDDILVVAENYLAPSIKDRSDKRRVVGKVV